jgi:3-phenylpropionate/trans-cinnamate dioxygenase ferredoxin reductase subunit
VPRTALAEAGGLTVDDGIVVDAAMRTSAEDVYAAGDVASYPDVRLGRRRVEHVDHAEKSGELAGRAMAGADATYDQTPFFWSDLFDDGYEAIGDLDTRLEVVEDWQGDDEPTDRGVVYYLDEGRVRGVLLWNVWDSVDDARALIESTQDEPVADPSSLRGRITG